MMFRIVLLALTVSSAGASAWAGMVEDCVQSSDSDLRIGGCTAVIRSGDWSGKDLFPAYFNRGTAYYNLKQYHRAIEDFDQAIRLNPGYARAYNNRGSAFESMGNNDNAMRDYETGIRIEGSESIKSWQRRLQETGYYDGAIDGIYGAGTRAALLACTKDPDC